MVPEVYTKDPPQGRHRLVVDTAIQNTPDRNHFTNVSVKYSPPPGVFQTKAVHHNKMCFMHPPSARLTILSKVTDFSFM
jgi:hypothetical protein